MLFCGLYINIESTKIMNCMDQLRFEDLTHPTSLDPFQPDRCSIDKKIENSSPIFIHIFFILYNDYNVILINIIIEIILQCNLVNKHTVLM